MPTFEITAPDGRKFRVTAPEGATQDQVRAFVSSQMAGAKPVDRGPDPTEGMSTFDRVAAGAGKALTDVGRGVGQMLGLIDQKSIDDAKRMDAALMGTTAGKVGNLVGNVGATIPLAFVPGANTVAGGAAVGALSGLLQPVASGESRAVNAGAGAIGGAAVPALFRGGQVVKSFLDPLYESGREQIVGRALRDAAGGQVDDVLRNLQAGPRVAGTQPTVAELAGNPGLAALQRASSAVNPRVTNDVAARQIANDEARKMALQALIPDRATAVAAREAATSPLYATAKGADITIDPALAELLQRDAMRTAMSRAERLASNTGESLGMLRGAPEQASAILGPNGLPAAVAPAVPASMPGRTAHYLKMALDDAANASPATGIAGNELRAIQGTRAEFMRALEDQVPAYAQARQTYAKMSEPITQSDVLGEILKRSTNNVQGSMTPAALNRALSDKTAESVTGRAGATLEKTLSVDQRAKLDSLLKDLQALDFSRNAGRGVGSDTVQKLAYSNLLDQAGVPTVMRAFAPLGIVGNLAAKAGNIAYKDANEKMAEQLANAMLSPELAAQLMRGAVRSPAAAALQNYGSRAGAVGLPGLLSTYAE